MRTFPASLAAATEGSYRPSPILRCRLWLFDQTLVEALDEPRVR
jgi:hypothetical protein